MKTFGLSFLASLALMLLCTPLRGWSFQYATLTEIIAYFLLTFFLLKKNTQHIGLCLLGIIIGRYVLDLPVRLTDFNRAQISLMVPIGSSLGILLGFIYFKVKNSWVPVVVKYSPEYDRWYFCYMENINIDGKKAMIKDPDQAGLTAGQEAN